MILRIKVTRDEFNAAESNGWVDGLYRGKSSERDMSRHVMSESLATKRFQK